MPVNSCRKLTKKQPVKKGRVARAAQLQAYADDMRRCPTESEAQLWKLLSGSAAGARFYRQQVISSFVVDFIAPAAGVVVEVDGGYHKYRARSDRRRSAIIAGLGYQLVVVKASALSNPSAVLARVQRAVVRGSKAGRDTRARRAGRL